MAVTSLSLNGASRAFGGNYGGKVPAPVSGRKRRVDPGWTPLILGVGTRFGAWLFLLYWAQRA